MVVVRPFSSASLIVLVTIANVILSAPTPSVTTNVPHNKYTTPANNTLSFPKISGSVFIRSDDDKAQGNATEPSLTQSWTSDRATNHTIREIRPTASTDSNIRKDTGFIKANPRHRVFPSVQAMSEEEEDDDEVDEFYNSQKKRILHILAGAGFGALVSLLIIVCIVCAVRLAASTMPMPKRFTDPTGGDLEDVIGFGDDVIVDLSLKTTNGIEQTATVVSLSAPSATSDEGDASKNCL
ncbi:Hypp1412 [Branchiostoma lanceolatum]|uniref:Hypp1412 protein n=1 Tax=Branchiostoma lanceolatum TaxID=7740 RepID=A0A8K0EIQ7_BRALA|nr:Hypp1412 [Branchiostoma lanceolatum]